MKFFLTLILFLSCINAKEVELYATVGMLSHHFGTNESGNDYNENHKAFGAEAVLDQRYTLAYLHFINSRDKTTDIIALGYRYDFIDSFGIYGVVGYQRGYCFDGLKSVECTEGKDNSGIAFMPMLYYRHKYFIVDFITQGSMVALKFNLKLYPY
ncbi:MAG: hypothetical protein A2023_03030 [Sulfuricurvum sp. GWF2_44_89]|uniref:Outer membrane protein beta-barrel domain-containing protein n=1 Tax=Sulfuricurvum kujiense TaxID=148813 RepID=A0A2D3WDX9_9BACT|nr:MULTISPECIES: hypothetical protein [Sulfuricurvum]OHD78945.1 MAG: hypothetical protein A2023_03030 [Sulfuricurvum sp. GWF2_44_89]OHD92294.1 MAG: hypothetical protein A2552_06640 [Sulfuricurvum sp. RIFOXYD2_FULL_44_160]OHD93267.1 MAG: hypothetical protein A2517_07980 [Sulfuricurvum sp. RIFOXYD12_FULL_44_77]DAB39511.1 MAG TPA: hypothetical protein CFH83_00370 [Sulfuricurvum kujiense]